MVKLIYGNKELKISRDNMFLSQKDQKILLDGRFVVDTGVPVTVSDKVRKSYYIGVLYEIFKRNYEEFGNLEIYDMMIESYPIFMKSRQIQNHLLHYQNLRINKDVFTSDW